MFALAISTGFIYPHVVALELTIRHIKTINSFLSLFTHKKASVYHVGLRPYIATTPALHSVSYLSR
jgi:hypothetical protein